MHHLVQVKEAGFAVNEAEQFFYDNAPWSYDPAKETPEYGRKRGAQILAIAERQLRDGPYFVSWDPDPEPWDGDIPYDGPVWIATLWSVDGTDRAVSLGALGSIACEDGDPYQRVIAAELMAEHLDIDE